MNFIVLFPLNGSFLTTIICFRQNEKLFVFFFFCLLFKFVCHKQPTRSQGGFFVSRVKKMSWWSEQSNHISENPFIVGCVVAVVTSLLSTYKRSPKMRFIARITEASTCALLSLGLTKLGIHYLDFSPDMVIPVSVFVSWIGTDSLKTALNKIFEKWLGKQEPKV